MKLHKLPRRLRACCKLALIFLYELVVSSWTVAMAAFKRELPQHAAIVSVPIALKTDMCIVALTNLVSLTPGTTSLHVSEDRSTLYIHCLAGVDPQAVIHSIQQHFEDTLKEIER